MGKNSNDSTVKIFKMKFFDCSSSSRSSKSQGEHICKYSKCICTSVKCNTFSILRPPPPPVCLLGQANANEKVSKKKKEHITFSSTAGTTTFINQILLFFFSCCCLFTLLQRTHPKHTLHIEMNTSSLAVLRTVEFFVHTHIQKQLIQMQIKYKTKETKRLYSETQSKCKYRKKTRFKIHLSFDAFEYTLFYRIENVCSNKIASISKAKKKKCEKNLTNFRRAPFFCFLFGCTTSDKGYYKGQKQMMCILNLAQMYMSMDVFFRVAFFVCDAIKNRFDLFYSCFFYWICLFIQVCRECVCFSVWGNRVECLVNMEQSIFPGNECFFWFTSHDKKGSSFSIFTYVVNNCLVCSFVCLILLLSPLQYSHAHTKKKYQTYFPQHRHRNNRDAIYLK